MKKILIATHFFYPTITPRAFRATELADELVRRGFEVDVLIGENEKLIKNYSKTNTNTNNLKGDSKKSIKNDVTKIPMYKMLISKLLISFFGETNVIKKRSFFKKLNIEEYNSIISVGPPFYTHYFISKKIRKIGWKGISITDWGDPFYKSGDANFMLPHMRHVQSRVLNTFNYLSIPVKEAKNYYVQFCKEDMIKIIPQGFSFEKTLKSTTKDFSKKKSPVFIYAGAFYRDVRDPENLLKFLTTLKQDFTFIIFTDLEGDIFENTLKPYKIKLADKLILNEKVPREELLSYFQSSDFLLNIENISSNQVPSKLIDLSLSERPILSIHPENIDETKIINFLSGNYVDQVKLDLSCYDIKNVASQFIELIDEEML
ncbi:hypothetical protein [Vagococcus fluvialis]|uniref:hypothetical protein n=1 Tax=Vagococcus fluvialis TaxID=2738 RepID=UPI001A904E01|nr:hypothetical protein [Vagococcus fluvialis]MBO0487242.1 hypothetical protein [Vagococcus fluvialis]